MTAKSQGKLTSKKMLYLILGIVTVCLLVGGVIKGLQTTSDPSRLNSQYPVSRINVPTIQYATVPPSAPAFTILLHSLGTSGITGRVTFQDVSGTVAVMLHIDGLPEEEEENIMPAELRYGTCASLGPLAYPMAAPDAGESETDLSINLKQFNMQKPMAAILYQSTEDHTAIACGDIP